MLEELRAADVTTPAVVLKLDPNVMHHGGLGVIRSLGRLGVPVYGVHEGPVAPAASSRYLPAGCSGSRRRTTWTGSPPGCCGLARRIGRPAVLLPTDDAGAIFLAEHGGPLRDSFLFADAARGAAPPGGGQVLAASSCAGDLGVPSPRAHDGLVGRGGRGLRGHGGLPGYRQAGHPVAGGRVPRRAAVAQHHDHPRPGRAGRGLAALHRGRAGLMLQEYIPGGPGQDWFFHGYCDAACRCQPAFTGVKDRSYPAHAGLTSLGHAAPNTELREQLTGLLAELGYRGIARPGPALRPPGRAVQAARLQPAAGRAVPAVRDTAGLDVARAAYLDLTGQPMAGAGQAAGRRFLVENYDPLGAAGYWRRGELRLTLVAASLRRVDELAWFARDDLRPFGLMCLRMGWRAAGHGPGLVRAATRRGRAPLSARASQQISASEWRRAAGVPAEPALGAKRRRGVARATRSTRKG